MQGAERRRQQEASDAALAKLRESQHAPASPSLTLQLRFEATLL